MKVEGVDLDFIEIVPRSRYQHELSVNGSTKEGLLRLKLILYFFSIMIGLS